MRSSFSCAARACSAVEKGSRYEILMHTSRLFCPFSKCNNLEAVKMLAKWKTWLVEIARVATNAQPYSRDVSARRASAQTTHTHTAMQQLVWCTSDERYSKSFLSLFMSAMPHCHTRPYIIWVKRKIWSRRKEIHGHAVWCIGATLNGRRRSRRRRIRKRRHEEEISEKKTGKNNFRKYCYHKA